MKYLKKMAMCALALVCFGVICALSLVICFAFFPAFVCAIAGGKEAIEKMVAALSATIDGIFLPAAKCSEVAK